MGIHFSTLLMLKGIVERSESEQLGHGGTA